MKALPAPGSAGAWVLAARPATLPVAVAPVAVGSAVAYASGTFRPFAALAALTCWNASSYCCRPS